MTKKRSESLRGATVLQESVVNSNKQIYKKQQFLPQKLLATSEISFFSTNSNMQKRSPAFFFSIANLKTRLSPT